MSLTAVLSRIDSEMSSALQRLTSFIRIPSISTDPTYGDAVMDAADWLATDLRSLGIPTSVRPTDGHPMVVGHSEGAGRHLLFYGHYDVQPVDPVELWDREPFESVVLDTPKGKVITGRGSSDDKGQLMTFVEACRNWKSVHGSLPCRITFLLEGEEESGSPSIEPFLRENSNELEADLALICDTGMFNPATPAITTSLRGLLGEEVTITGPDRDLHSGMYGGIAMNPARVLARIIAGLHDERGRITVPGFYDGVFDLDESIEAQWQALGFDEADFLGEVGLSKRAGEADRSGLEMIWSRPTCDVNGIACGYTGEGFKTVLPSKASAKLSFRLVAGQNPLKLRESFRDMVRGMVPSDCKVEFTGHGAGPACVMAMHDPAFELARKALSDEWPNEAAFIGCGGSIPIASYFKQILGMDSLLIGFGRDDDRIHSPNEKYDLESFHKGIRSWARVLAALS